MSRSSITLQMAQLPEVQAPQCQEAERHQEMQAWNFVHLQWLFYQAVPLERVRPVLCNQKAGYVVTLHMHHVYTTLCSPAGYSRQCVTAVAACRLLWGQVDHRDHGNAHNIAHNCCICSLMPGLLRQINTLARCVSAHARQAERLLNNNTVVRKL